MMNTKCRYIHKLHHQDNNLTLDQVAAREWRSATSVLVDSSPGGFCCSAALFSLQPNNALIDAVGARDADAIRSLLESDPIDKEFAFEALTLACKSGFVEGAAALVSCDVLDRTLEDGGSLLHIAISSPEIVRLLIVNGANPNTVDQQGNTPLHIACSAKQVESARILLSFGADPSLRSKVKLNCVAGPVVNTVCVHRMENCHWIVSLQTLYEISMSFFLHLLPMSRRFVRFSPLSSSLVRHINIQLGSDTEHEQVDEEPLTPSGGSRSSIAPPSRLVPEASTSLGGTVIAPPPPPPLFNNDIPFGEPPSSRGGDRSLAMGTASRLPALPQLPSVTLATAALPPPPSALAPLQPPSRSRALASAPAVPGASIARPSFSPSPQPVDSGTPAAHPAGLGASDTEGEGGEDAGDRSTVVATDNEDEDSSSPASDNGGDNCCAEGDERLSGGGADGSTGGSQSTGNTNEDGAVGGGTASTESIGAPLAHTATVPTQDETTGLIAVETQGGAGQDVGQLSVPGEPPRALASPGRASENEGRLLDAPLSATVPVLPLQQSLTLPSLPAPPGAGVARSPSQPSIPSPPRSSNASPVLTPPDTPVDGPPAASSVPPSIDHVLVPRPGDRSARDGAALAAASPHLSEHPAGSSPLPLPTEALPLPVASQEPGAVLPTTARPALEPAMRPAASPAACAPPSLAPSIAPDRPSSTGCAPDAFHAPLCSSGAATVLRRDDDRRPAESPPPPALSPSLARDLASVLAASSFDGAVPAVVAPAAQLSSSCADPCPRSRWRVHATSGAAATLPNGGAAADGSTGAAVGLPVLPPFPPMRRLAVAAAVRLRTVTCADAGDGCQEEDGAGDSDTQESPRDDTDGEGNRQRGEGTPYVQPLSPQQPRSDRHDGGGEDGVEEARGRVGGGRQSEAGGAEAEEEEEEAEGESGAVREEIAAVDREAQAAKCTRAKEASLPPALPHAPRAFDSSSGIAPLSPSVKATSTTAQARGPHAQATASSPLERGALSTVDHAAAMASARAGPSGEVLKGRERLEGCGEGCTRASGNGDNTTSLYASSVPLPALATKPTVPALDLRRAGVAPRAPPPVAPSLSAVAAGARDARHTGRGPSSFYIPAASLGPEEAPAAAVDTDDIGTGDSSEREEESAGRYEMAEPDSTCAADASSEPKGTDSDSRRGKTALMSRAEGLRAWNR